MPTTTTKKMLERAAEYEQRAHALRLAAAEMKEPAARSKTIKIRVRPDEAEPEEPETPEAPETAADAPAERESTNNAVRMARRREMILAYLQSGPKPLRDLMTALRTHGVTVTDARIAQMLHEMPEVGRRGMGISARWLLKPKRKA